MSQLRVYGIDLGQTNITSCVASHNLHRKKLMRTTRDIHRPWSLWGMLTICWKSNRAGHKESTKFLECMDAWHRWLGSQLGKALCWTWHLNKNQLDAYVAAATMRVLFSILRQGNKAKSESQSLTPKEQTLAYSETCFEEPYEGTLPQRKGCRRIHFQGPLSSSITVC